MSIENNLRKDYIRHGEAVGLGLLSELFYVNKRKIIFFKSVFKLLETFNLPTSLNTKKFL